MVSSTWRPLDPHKHPPPSFRNSLFSLHHGDVRAPGGSTVPRGQRPIAFCLPQCRGARVSWRADDDAFHLYPSVLQNHVGNQRSAELFLPNHLRCYARPRYGRSAPTHANACALARANTRHVRQPLLVYGCTCCRASASSFWFMFGLYMFVAPLGNSQ